MKNWKKIQPLTVDEILSHNSPVAVDFKRTKIMSHKFPDALVVGQFLQVTAGSSPTPHGIVRVIAHDNTILEGQYISGRTSGYCRAFHADGDEQAFKRRHVFTPLGPIHTHEECILVL